MHERLSNLCLLPSATSIAKLIAVKSSKQDEPRAHTHTRTHTQCCLLIKLVCIVMQMPTSHPLTHTHLFRITELETHHPTDPPPPLGQASKVPALLRSNSAALLLLLPLLRSTFRRPSAGAKVESMKIATPTLLVRQLRVVFLVCLCQVHTHTHRNIHIKRAPTQAHACA